MLQCQETATCEQPATRKWWTARQLACKPVYLQLFIFILMFLSFSPLPTGYMAIHAKFPSFISHHTTSLILHRTASGYNRPFLLEYHSPLYNKHRLYICYTLMLTRTVCHLIITYNLLYLCSLYQGLIAFAI